MRPIPESRAGRSRSSLAPTPPRSPALAIVVVISFGLPLAGCGAPCIPALSRDVLPSDAAQLVRDGESALDVGDAVRALAVFRATLEEHPDHFRALHGEQESLLRLGRTEEARAIAVERVAKKNDAAAQLLTARLEQGVAADAALARALELEPDDPWVHYALGVVAAGRGDYTAAESQFDRSLEACFPPPEARLCRARVRASFASFDDAVSDYRAYLAERPRDLASMHELATLLHGELGKRDDALDLYRAMLAIDPGQSAATVGIAVIAADRGDFAQAEALFRSVAAVEPVAWLDLGLLCRDELGRRAEALECFRKYLDFEGPNADRRSVTDRLFIVPGYVEELERELAAPPSESRGESP